MKVIDKIVLPVIFLLLCSSLVAQEQKAEEGLGDAAANAVNPGAFVTKLQIQPNFTWKDNKARQLLLNARIIKPSGTIGLPFIKTKDPKKVYTIYRLEVPFVGQTFPNTPAADGTGLSDLTVLSLVSFKKKWGLYGIGSGLIIPVVKPVTISGGKWCTGVSGFIVNTKTKGFIYGFSVQQFFSIAGSSSKPDKSFMIINPILNKILKGGYFVSFGPNVNLDWKNKEYNVPISISLGKAFAKNLSAFIAPQIGVAGPSKGDVTFQFQLNAMFPPSKK